MNEEIFKEGMMLFCENFSFEVNKSYMNLVFNSLESIGIDEKQFGSAGEKMIMTKKKSDFFGRPAVADWLDMLGKKTLTDEQKNTQRASVVMACLESNTYFNSCADKPYQWQWSGDKYTRFDDPVINDMIEKNFRGCSILIDRFKEQKNAGFTELFRKKLVEFMGISEIAGGETMMIESDEQETKNLESCVDGLAGKFNPRRK